MFLLLSNLKFVLKIIINFVVIHLNKLEPFFVQSNNLLLLQIWTNCFNFITTFFNKTISMLFKLIFIQHKVEPVITDPQDLTEILVVFEKSLQLLEAFENVCITVDKVSGNIESMSKISDVLDSLSLISESLLGVSKILAVPQPLLDQSDFFVGSFLFFTSAAAFILSSGFTNIHLTDSDFKFYGSSIIDWCVGFFVEPIIPKLPIDTTVYDPFYTDPMVAIGRMTKREFGRRFSDSYMDIHNYIILAKTKGYDPFSIHEGWTFEALCKLESDITNNLLQYMIYCPERYAYTKGYIYHRGASNPFYKGDQVIIDLAEILRLATELMVLD